MLGGRNAKKDLNYCVQDEEFVVSVSHYIFYKSGRNPLGLHELQH